MNQNGSDAASSYLFGGNKLAGKCFWGVQPLWQFGVASRRALYVYPTLHLKCANKQFDNGFQYKLLNDQTTILWLLPFFMGCSRCKKIKNIFK